MLPADDSLNQLPERCLARCGTTAFMHEELSWFDFAPDGRTLVSAGGDGALRIWDVARAKQTHVLAIHEGLVHSAALFPDGQRVLSGGVDGNAHVTRLDTATIERTLRCGAQVTGVAVAASGAFALGTSDAQRDRVTLQFVDDAQKITLLDEQGVCGLWYLAFSPDGKTLAALNVDDHLHEQVCFWAWDWRTKTLLHHARAGSYARFGVLRYLDGHTVAARPWPAPAEPYAEAISLLDTHRWTLRATHDAWSAARDAEGRTWLFGDRGLQLQGADRQAEGARSPGFPGERTLFALSPHRSVAAMQSNHHLIALHALPSGAQLPTAFPRSPAEAIAFSADAARLWLLPRQDGRAFGYDARTGQCTDSVRCGSLEASERTLSAAGVYELVSHVFPAAELTLRRAQGSECPLTGSWASSAAASSADGRLLAVLDGQQLRTYDVEGGKLLSTLKVLLAGQEIERLVVSSRGAAVLAASLGRQSTVIALNVLTGQLLPLALPADLAYAPHVAVADRADVIAVSTREGVRVFEADVARDLSAPELQGLTALALSADGTHLAAGFVDGSLIAFDHAHARWRSTRAHRGAITALAFSADGTRLASGAADSTALVWSV